MATNQNGLKRYTILLPEELFQEVQRIADEKHISVVEMFRKFVRLGLLAHEIEKSSDSALIIRQGDTEREIILI